MNLKKLSTKLIMALTAVLLGGVVALVVWLFVAALRFVTESFWGEFANSIDFLFFPLVVCALGGLLIGLWQKYIWPMPVPLEESFEAMKEDKKSSYKGLWKTTISAFLPLAFGGSVGPESGLVNVIIGLCNWVGDKLKKIHITLKESARIGLAAVITVLFGSPVAGVIAPIEAKNEQGYQLPRISKILLYILAVLGGFGVMLLLNNLFGGGSGLPRFERAIWDPGELLISIPLALVGILAGYIYFAADKICIKIADIFKKNTVLKAVLCGVILGLCGTLLPLTMFSGEEQMFEVMQNFTSIGIFALIATGLVKLIITPLCVRFGWNGGNIFPVIFAGVSLSYGLAAVLNLDPILCITVITTALLATVMKRPLLAIGILFLCFPIADLVFMAISVGIVYGVMAIKNIILRDKSPSLIK